MADIKESTWVRFKLGDYFVPGSHKTAISLPDLVSQTNNFSVKNRPGCTPSLNQSNPRDLYLGYNVKCTLKDSDPNGHEVKVHFDLSQVKDVTTAKSLDVAVACSCPAFLYWGGQWNAHMHDALEGEPRPLLTAPTERLDLRENFIICKHIKAVSERILPSVQHNVNNILRKREVEENLKSKSRRRKPSLEERQNEMKERVKTKRRKDQNKNLNTKFRKQVEDQERNPIYDVVKRDMPATEAERERVPVLEPDTIPEPEAHKDHEQLPPIPEIDDLLPVPEAEDEAPPPPAPAPDPAVKPGPQAQKLTRPTEEDKKTVRDLVEEDRRARNKKPGGGWR